MKNKQDHSDWKMIRVRKNFHAQLQLMTAGTGKSIAGVIADRFPEISLEHNPPGRKAAKQPELPFPE